MKYIFNNYQIYIKAFNKANISFKTPDYLIDASVYNVYLFKFKREEKKQRLSR